MENIHRTKLWLGQVDADHIRIQWQWRQNLSRNFCFGIYGCAGKDWCPLSSIVHYLLNESAASTCHYMNYIVISCHIIVNDWRSKALNSQSQSSLLPTLYPNSTSFTYQFHSFPNLLPPLDSMWCKLSGSNSRLQVSVEPCFEDQPPATVSSCRIFKLISRRWRILYLQLIHTKGQPTSIVSSL